MMISGCRLLLSVFAALLLATPCYAAASAEVAENQFKQANALFQQQKFEEARDAYQALLDAGYRTPQVLYNLGTAESRVGELAAAYGHLLAAQRLDPRNEAIQVNLEQVVQGLFPDERKRPQTDPWRRVALILTASEWSLVMLVGLLIVAGAYAFSTALRRAELAGVLRAVAWTGVVGLVMVAPVAATSIYYHWVVSEAVVVRAAEVRSGPDERFAVIETVPSASKVRVLGNRDNGYQNVKTLSGRIGYMPVEALEVI